MSSLGFVALQSSKKNSQMPCEEDILRIASRLQNTFVEKKNHTVAIIGLQDSVIAALVIKQFVRLAHPQAQLRVFIFDRCPLAREEVLSDHHHQLQAEMKILQKGWPPCFSGAFYLPWPDPRVGVSFQWGDLLVQLGSVNEVFDMCFVEQSLRPVIDQYLGKHALAFARQSSHSFVPRSHRRRPSRKNYFARPSVRNAKHISIIGGGVAGVSCALLFAKRGFRVSLVDSAETLMNGASGNRRAAVFTRISPFDSRNNRFHTSAYHTAIHSLRECSFFQPCGLLSLLQPKEVKQWESFFLQHALDDSFAQFCSPPKASEIAGEKIAVPSLYYPQSGLVDPVAMGNMVFQEGGISLFLQQKVSKLDRIDEQWRLINTAGEEIVRSEIVIFCTSYQSDAFSIFSEIPIKPIAGQISYVPHGNLNIRTIITADGYITPQISGSHLVGATYRLFDTSPDVCANDHRKNLHNLQSIDHSLYERSAQIPLDQIDGRVSVRAATNDYMPIVGPLPDVEFYRENYCALSNGNQHTKYPNARYREGLYANIGHGSKGFTQSWLASELLYALITGLPLPVDRTVYQALHPGRFLIRKMKRGLHRAKQK